jgi:hypothetical protein
LGLESSGIIGEGGGFVSGAGAVFVPPAGGAAVAEEMAADEVGAAVARGAAVAEENSLFWGMGGAPAGGWVLKSGWGTMASRKRSVGAPATSR